MLTAVVMLLLLSSCGMPYEPPVQPDLYNINVVDEPVKPSETPAQAQPEDTPVPPAASDEPVQNAEPSESPEPSEKPGPDRDGYYYDVENVVLYLNEYGTLPPNYITKNEARELGWEGGTPEAFKPGSAIGGDRFGNYEGALPKVSGRSYTECDIDTNGRSSRGSKRLIFSSDGLYFYTDDHYESFRELYVTQEGSVEWK